MYSFPPIMPATGDNMNYVSVVYAITFIVILLWWFIKARKEFPVGDLVY